MNKYIFETSSILWQLVRSRGNLISFEAYYIEFGIESLTRERYFLVLNEAVNKNERTLLVSKPLNTQHMFDRCAIFVNDLCWSHAPEYHNAMKMCSHRKSEKKTNRDSYSTFFTAKKQPSEPVNVLKYLKCNPLHERI